MENNKFTWWYLLVGAVILAIAILFVGNSLLQSNQPTWYGMSNSISVMGEGKASVKPDMLVINLSISELADSTEAAQNQVNEKLSKLKEILKAADIADKDIKTLNVNSYPEYDRKETGRTLLWYRTQQSLSINITGEDFGEKWGTLMNQIAKIGWINIDNTYFDLKDKNTALQWAREKALLDAKTKAEQLAKASGVRLGKPIVITDNSYSYMPGPMYYAKDAGMGAGSEIAVNQSLSPGETEVTINVNVIYKIK